MAREGGSATGQRLAGRNRPKCGATGSSTGSALKCGISHWHASVKRARKSATAMRWLTGDEQDTMDTTIVHVDEDMDFENLAGLDLATLKKQLRLPIRGSPKRGSDSRSGTWP